jgi:hypothetical protein
MRKPTPSTSSSTVTSVPADIYTLLLPPFSLSYSRVDDAKDVSFVRASEKDKEKE